MTFLAIVEARSGREAADRHRGRRQPASAPDAAHSHVIVRVGDEVDPPRFGLPVQNGVSLCDQVLPLDAKSAPPIISTDVGDVSWVVPTVQAWGGTYAIGTRGHSWQVTAQGKLPAAHKGLVHVAKVMAGTAVDVIGDEVLLARAKADHQARVSRNPYVCPLPDDLEPPITMSA